MLINKKKMDVKEWNEEGERRYKGLITTKIACQMNYIFFLARPKELIQEFLENLNKIMKHSPSK